MSRTILCTVDFSPSSKHALQCAITLARDLQAHLIVLYTYRLIREGKEEVIEAKKKIEAQAAHNFAAIENEMLKGSGITYEFKTEIGFVADRIDALIRKLPIGFIVIDKNMTLENKETFEELLENMLVPTLIVPG